MLFNECSSSHTRKALHNEADLNHPNGLNLEPPGAGLLVGINLFADSAVRRFRYLYIIQCLFQCIRYCVTHSVDRL